MNAVSACGASEPQAVFILLRGIRPLGIDLIADTGNLQEAAAFFAAAGKAGTPFQSIQQLLSGYRLQAGNIAEGVNIRAGLIGHYACDCLISDTAAIHDCGVHIQIHLVKQIVERVCGKITCVSLLHSNEP